MRDPFFVVTTGRSGSVSLALTLSQHPILCALHEPWQWLIPAAYNRVTGEQGRSAESDEWWGMVVPRPAGVQRAGIVDQKLAPFIGDLAALWAEAQFVHLVRDGRWAVASMYARGWYTDQEAQWPPHLWAKYRIGGPEVGAELQGWAWAEMSPFARCCWYWGWWNQYIRAELEKVGGGERWRVVRLEDLAEEEAGEGVLEALQDWLGVRPCRMEMVHANAGHKRITAKVPWAGWSKAQRSEFGTFCGEGMERWYPGWRETTTN